MPLIPKRILRIATLGILIFTLTVLYSISQNPNPQPPQSYPFDLNHKECRTTFPLQYTLLDKAIARGPFAFHRSPADYTGLVQARIRNNTLHILTTSPNPSPQTLHQRTAVLSQIHRALITSPAGLPDTYFAFCVNDVPKERSWGFAVPNHRKDLQGGGGHGGNIWPMPLFTSWSWPKAGLGSMDAILERIARVESDYMDWDKKIDKVIWRGTPWFNPLRHPHLRQTLLKATKFKKWAETSALNISNAIPIDQFCRYKYLVYTEGVGYSGRLPYHQACASVLITAPLGWVTLSAVLMRPIWAQDLVNEVIGGKDKGRRKGVVVDDGEILGMVGSYKEANAVYVEPDFEELDGLVGVLRKYPYVAERIARNQREGVVGKGYLSMGAETCYWRALIRGWGESAVIEEREWADLEGERYETWLLQEVSTSRGGTREKAGSV